MKKDEAENLFQRYKELDEKWEEWDTAIHEEGQSLRTGHFKEVGLSDYEAREQARRLQRVNQDCYRKKRDEVDEKLKGVEDELFSGGWEITSRAGEPIGIASTSA